MEVEVIPGFEPVFARLGEEGKQVLSQADDAARELRHNYIGTEHILLGLLRMGEGVAAKALDHYITLDRAVSWIERVVGLGEEIPLDRILFTPRAKSVLELALREALNLLLGSLNSEAILLGLVRENSGVAARLLLDFDLDAEKVRIEVIRQLGREPHEPSSLSRVMSRARELFVALEELKPENEFSEEDHLELQEGLAVASLLVVRRRRK